MAEPYADFLTRMHEVHDLRAALGLLAWDQETYLPQRGVPARARQKAALAAVIHDKVVDPALGELIEELAAAPYEGFEAANLREAKRLRDRAVKIPRSLVTALAEVTTVAQQAWVQARTDNDWAYFEPYLERLVALKRQEADAVEYEKERYDALLDEYEPDATVDQLAPVFTQLREELSRLLDRIAGAEKKPSRAVLRQPYDPALQDLLGRRLLADVGFDFTAGRLDLSAHPFTEGLSPCDVRITTRYEPEDLAVGIYANLHEGGHALYEMGLPPEHEATPAGQPVSLGIHESQSRLWENFVGRSREFMDYSAPLLHDLFPSQLQGFSADDLYRATNVVAATPIRIEADEVTYNLHILLRWEVERALIAGDIAVADVPAVWRQRALEDLQIELRSDAEGPLQDIHWAFGCFGYFPTYTLGNLYAAQFFAHARTELPDLPAQIARGEFAPLREWLRLHIHARGSSVSADTLCRELTGRPLSIEPLVSHLRTKFGQIYKL